MQYRNLNLERLQAFAPERKLIDKENIYNAFLGLSDALQKGANAYTLNEIYQLSPEEQQRKMAEYRAYKDDFSGFDNIEQAKLRQAEMNALKEQQRADKEYENAIVQRDKERSYNALTREYDVLTNELLNNMNKFNSENVNSPYRVNNKEDINNKEVQFRFLQEQDTGLLQRFITNLTEKEKLEYEPKNVRAKAEDVFGLEKIDRAETKRAETKTYSTEDVEENADKQSIINIDKFEFERPNEIETYLKNPKYQSEQGFTDDQKNKIKKYIKENYKSYNNKVIIDDLSEDEINKINKDIGFNTITQAEVDKLKKRAEEKETEKKVAKAIRENLTLFNAPEGYTDKQVIEWAIEIAPKRDQTVGVALNKIFETYNYIIKERGK